MPIIVKSESVMLQMLFVYMTFAYLAAVGCAYHQPPAAIPDDQQEDVSISLGTLEPPATHAPAKMPVRKHAAVPPKTLTPPLELDAPAATPLPPLARLQRLPPVDSPSDTWSGTSDRNAVHLASAFEAQISAGNYSTAEGTESVARRGGSILSTLHMNDVDVRQALDMLGRTHGANILIAPGVTGQVTANLEELDFDTAFNAILKLSDLVAKREGGLIYVYAKKDYLDDIRVQSFPLDYLSVIQVLPVIQTLLSANGQVSAMETDPVDNRKTGESIVVTDTPTVLGRVAQYLDQVDVPPRQVMIEAHILQITLSDDLRHGINYKHAIDMIGGSSIELDITGFADPTSSPAMFARLASTDVDGLLHLLKTTTDAKTLASPRLMVVNGQKARLQVGEQLPYKVITITETVAVEEVRFLDVGVVLEVTPQISRDGRVLLYVKPQVSEGKFDPDSGLPGEDTREVESSVLLEDGQGMVIGGLIQEEYRDVQAKLPVLGDLRWVGRLFQKRERVKERTEVVITLVPRIIPLGGVQFERDAIDAERSQSRLYYGPLCPDPRPWEPRLPDAIGNPRNLRVGIRSELGDGCWNCGLSQCSCPVPVIQGDVFERIEPPPTAPAEPPIEAPFVPAEPSARSTVLPPVSSRR